MKFCASNLIPNQVNRTNCLNTNSHLVYGRTENSKHIHNGHVVQAKHFNLGQLFSS